MNQLPPYLSKYKTIPITLMYKKHTHTDKHKVPIPLTQFSDDELRKTSHPVFHKYDTFQ